MSYEKIYSVSYLAECVQPVIILLLLVVVIANNARKIDIKIVSY